MKVAKIAKIANVARFVTDHPHHPHQRRAARKLLSKGSSAGRLSAVEAATPPRRLTSGPLAPRAPVPPGRGHRNLHCNRIATVLGAAS